MIKTYHFNENHIYIGFALVEKEGDSTVGAGYVLTAPPDENRLDRYKLVDGLWVEYDEIYTQIKKNELNGQVSARLNTFARTKNYDNLAVACSYLNSSVEHFAKEAAYCISIRDQTWLAFYELMREIDMGALTMPESLAEIEDRLPVLAWPPE